MLTPERIKELDEKYGVKATTTPISANTIEAGRARVQELRTIRERFRQNQARGGSDTSFSDLPGNILPSAGRVVGGVVEAIKHPIQTAKAVGSVVAGGVEKLIPGEQGQEDSFNTMVQFLKDRYGSPESLKQTVINDPAGFAFDVSTLLSGGGALLKGGAKAAELAGASKVASTAAKAGEIAQTAAKVTDPLLGVTKTAEMAAKGAGKVVAGTLGLTTTRGGQVIETAFRSRNPEFVKAMRNEGIKGELVSNLRSGLETLKEQRASDYQSRLQEISKSKRSIDISPVTKTLDEQLAKFNIQAKPNGEFDFSRSTISANEGLKDVQGVIETLKDWGTKAGDRTPFGLDILKRRLDDFYSESGQARALVSSVKNEVRKILNKEVPGYKEMTTSYADASNLIDEIEKTFSIGGKASTETAMNKIINSLRGDKELRTQLVQKIEESTGKNITDSIAGAALNDWLPPSLAGKLFAAGGAGGVNLGPRIFLGLVTSLATLSPRIVGEVVHALGYPVRFADKVSEAVRTISNKVPGISNMTREQLDAIIFQAARNKETVERYTPKDKK